MTVAIEVGGKSERVEKLKTALKGLGSGKHKIAECLKENKIKGVRGDTESCPVAVFIKKKVFPKSISVDVDSNTVTVGFKGKGQDDEQYVSVDLPKAVQAFIADFDSDDEESYGFLVKKSA